MSNKATDFLREVKKQTTFAAIAMLVMGILLLLGSLSLICKALGLVMLAVGLVYTVLYFINLTQGARVSSQILFGIALLMLGAIFYFKGGILDSLLGLFFAFALAVDGASKLDRSVALFRSRNNAGWLVLLFALAAIAVALLIVFSVLSGTRIIGICLIVEGIIDLVTLALFAPKRPRSKK